MCRQNKIEVQTSIATKSGAEADEIIAQHSDKSLKNALRNVGLPEGRFQLQPRLASQSFTTETVWTPVIVSLVCPYMYVCILHTYIYVCIYVFCIHICIYTLVFIRIFIYLYTYICIHTYVLTLQNYQR